MCYICVSSFKFRTTAILTPGEGRVLVLLLDTSIGMWEQLRRNDLQKSSAGPSHLNQASFISQFLQFLNTYLMMQEGNKATVFAVDGSGRCAFSSTLVCLYNLYRHQAHNLDPAVICYTLLQYLQVSPSPNNMPPSQQQTKCSTYCYSTCKRAVQVPSRQAPPAGTVQRYPASMRRLLIDWTAWQNPPGACTPVDQVNYQL